MPGKRKNVWIERNPIIKRVLLGKVPSKWELLGVLPCWVKMPTSPKRSLTGVNPIPVKRIVLKENNGTKSNSKKKGIPPKNKNLEGFFGRRIKKERGLTKGIRSLTPWTE